MNRAFLEMKLRHLGLPRTIAYYAGRSLQRAAGFDAYSVLCLESGARIPQAPPLRRLEVGPVDEGRLREAAVDPGSGLTVPDVLANLARGESCFGAFVDGVLASHLWIARDVPPPHLQDDLHVRFDPAWGFSRWAFTRPEHRGLRLHPIVKGAALRAEHARGGRGLLSVVHVANFESLRAARRIGCRRVGYLFTKRSAGATRGWSSAGSRSFGVSVVVAPATPTSSVHGPQSCPRG